MKKCTEMLFEQMRGVIKGAQPGHVTSPEWDEGEQLMASVWTVNCHI